MNEVADSDNKTMQHSKDNGMPKDIGNITLSHKVIFSTEF